MKDTSDRIILGAGDNAIFSSDTKITGINNNRLIIAPSGGGKTMSITEPILLEATHSSQIVTLSKKRLVTKYKALFRKRGYKVLELNFVNPAESNVAYDPLEYIQSYSDITFLAESIVMADSRKERSNADPYWDEASVSLLSSLISYCITTNTTATFADVLELFDSLKIEDDGGRIKTNFGYKFDFLAKSQPSCFAVTNWRTFCNLPLKTASCIFSTLSASLDKMFSPDLRKSMRINRKLNFEKLASEKTILFILTSPVNSALNAFINLFYSTAFKQLFEFAENQPDGRLPIPVHVLCDDFATGGRIQSFPELISIFREKEISVTLLLQSEHQLESMYGTSNAMTISGNCDTTVFMGTNDIKTARSISERLNVPLEDVLYQPLGQVVIFRRGQRPIVTQRYDILNDDRYIKITKQYEDNIAKREQVGR